MRSAKELMNIWSINISFNNRRSMKDLVSIKSKRDSTRSSKKITAKDKTITTTTITINSKETLIKAKTILKRQTNLSCKEKILV
jgi:hypothetical protein